MKTIEDYLDSIKHLALFRTYTTYPRYFEILLSTSFWLNLIILGVSIFLTLIKYI